MHHLKAFSVEYIDPPRRLGTVIIAADSTNPSKYAYYFRNEAGELTELKGLENMSVKECRRFEEGELKQLIIQHVASMKLSADEWKFYRTRPTVWDDAGAVAPEITNENWLETKQFLFEDSFDEGLKDDEDNFKNE